MEKPLGRRKRSPLASLLLWGMVAVLVILGLLLPPVSLGQRLFRSDFTRLDAGNPQASHPDGLELVVDPTQLDGSVRVKLDALPRDHVLGGQVPDSWQAAVRALPDYLKLLSPLYGIEFDQDASPAVTLKVVIPNDAEPYRLLDLYSWDGTQWAFLAHTRDLATDRMVSGPGAPPKAVAAFQAGPLTPVVAMSADQADSLPPETTGVVGELHSVGVSLGPGGALVGQVTPATGDGARFAGYAVSGSQDAELTSALLADPGLQQVHLDALTNLVVKGGFEGLNLDYQGVKENQREAFSAFVAELAARLHSAGHRLIVTLPAPQMLADGGWNTQGYDWPGLGSVADRVQVSLPLEPAGYVQDARVDQILSWAVTRVNRYRLTVAINAIGVQHIDGVWTPVHTAEALAPLNSSVVRVDPGAEELEPGNEVVVQVPPGMLTEDLVAGAYSATYAAEGRTVTVWLPAGSGLNQRLAVLTRFNLGAVMLNGLVSSDIAGELTSAVTTFLASAAFPAGQTAALTWTVQDEAGAALSQEPGDLNAPVYTWHAVGTPGIYAIKGQLTIGGQVADLGAVRVAVVPAATATATATATPTPTPEPSSTPTPQEVAEGGGGSSDPEPPPGDADAVISGSVVNVREGPGTVFRVTTQLAGGTPLQIHAVNPDLTWLRIETPDGTQGWVFAGLCTVYINLSDRPVEDIPLPTPAPTSTPDPDGFVPPPAPPPSPGGGFELGGHIRSWNYLGQMASARMNWVKVQVHYGEDASGLVGMAHGNGYKIQLSALGSPGMVTQPNFHADFSAWVGRMAAAGADAIEVWNEPNIDREWAAGQISPASYTQLLCAAYSAIKNANAGTAVISAAPAPTGWFGGCSGAGCDDLPWLQGMYNAGAANCMDYIGAHHNSGATSPSASSGHPADGGGGHHSWYFMPQTRLYYSVFGGSRKLFYTEMGYASQEGVDTFADQWAWARGITNAQQAAWLAEAVTLSRSSGMVRCIIVWNIDFARYGNDPQDGYAIIRPGGSCPACGSLAAAMGG